MIDHQSMLIQRSSILKMLLIPITRSYTDNANRDLMHLIWKNLLLWTSNRYGKTHQTNQWTSFKPVSRPENQTQTGFFAIKTPIEYTGRELIFTEFQLSQNGTSNMSTQEYLDQPLQYFKAIYIWTSIQFFFQNSITISYIF
jgi:hypothetical protein